MNEDRGFPGALLHIGEADAVDLDCLNRWRGHRGGRDQKRNQQRHDCGQMLGFHDGAPFGRARRHARSPRSHRPKGRRVLSSEMPADGITLPVCSRCRQSRLIEQLIRQYLISHIDASEAEAENVGGNCCAAGFQFDLCRVGVKPGLPPWGPHVRFRRVQTLVREGSPLVKLRNSA